MSPPRWSTRQAPTRLALAAEPVDRRKEALQVAGLVGAPAVTPIGVVDHVRHVVVDHESVETDPFEGQHHLDRIKVPLAEEALLELRDRPLHVAEVDVEDLAALAEV